MLTQYGLEIDDYGDFLKAVKAIAMQSQGANWTDSLTACNIPKNAKYTPKWVKLFQYAGDLIHKQLSTHVRNVVTSTVQQEWPAIIKRTVNMALNGSDRDALEAAKFLQTYYIGPAMQAAPSAEAEAQEYLKRGKSFDPLAIIHKGTILDNKPIDRELSSTVPADLRPDTQEQSQ